MLKDQHTGCNAIKEDHAMTRLPSSFSPSGSLSRAYKDFLTQFASAEGIGGTITRDEQADGDSGGPLLFLSKPGHTDRQLQMSSPTVAVLARQRFTSLLPSAALRAMPQPRSDCFVRLRKKVTDE